jgi:hypothetical protein
MYFNSVRFVISVTHLGSENVNVWHLSERLAVTVTWEGKMKVNWIAMGGVKMDVATDVCPPLGVGISLTKRPARHFRNSLPANWATNRAPRGSLEVQFRRIWWRTHGRDDRNAWVLAWIGKHERTRPHSKRKCEDNINANLNEMRYHRWQTVWIPATWFVLQLSAEIQSYIICSQGFTEFITDIYTQHNVLLNRSCLK